MIETVAAFIREKQLASPPDRILAAVSGGIDSVVLCDILSRLPHAFAIAHCHFGLRGEESDADELFVKKLAKKYQVPFFSKHFPTSAFAHAQKVSTQMAARTLRYTWFEQLRQEQGYAAVATAHHLSDTAETLLLNLTRGTGIAGLHGIPSRNGAIIRPLLCLTRDQIWAYLREHRLPWREDSSNASAKYQRNLIRQEVVPVLKQINPNFEHTLQRSIARFEGAEAIVGEYVEQIRQIALKRENGITFLDIAPIASAASPLVVLLELLRPYQFNFEVVSEILSALGSPSGTSFLSPTHLLVKDRGRLVLSPQVPADKGPYLIREGQQALEMAGASLLLRQFPAEGYTLSALPTVAALDRNLLRFPLQVRQWAPGDWFIPLGMTGKKKISDFLIDRKVPLNLKDKVMVLVSDEAIAWVIGYRPDNRFRISDQTRRILEISYRLIKNGEPPDS